jgi:hypothetical protein
MKCKKKLWVRPMEETKRKRSFWNLGGVEIDGKTVYHVRNGGASVYFTPG